MGIQLLQARMPALDRWEDLAVPILVLIEGSCFRNLPQHHFIPFLDRTSRVSGRFSCRFPFHKPSWPVVSFYIRLSITIYHDSLKITAPKMPIVHQATIVLVAVLDVRMSIVFDSLVAAPQRGRVDGDSSGYQASKKCEFNFTIQKSSTIEWYVYIYYISISFYQANLNLSYWSRWVWSSGMKKHENWRCPSNFQTNHDQPIWNVHSVYLGSWVYQRLDSISWLFKPEVNSLQSCSSHFQLESIWSRRPLAAVDRVRCVFQHLKIHRGFGILWRCLSPLPLDLPRIGQKSQAICSLDRVTPVTSEKCGELTTEIMELVAKSLCLIDE